MHSTPAGIPRFLYGTAWKEDATEDCVRAALEAGFVGFDTANQRKHYFEAGCGNGLKHALATRRDQLFLQTKFTYQRGQDHRLPYDPEASYTDQVAQSFARSLIHLGVDRIDSYILHGPMTGEGLVDADWETWRAMEALVDNQTVRFLGISNVNAAQLRTLCEGSQKPVTFVQNRCYANRDWDADVRQVCVEFGVRYQGFSLLTANRDLWNSDATARLAEQREQTPAQVIFSHALSLGILPLTGTTNPSHMAADLLSTPAAAPHL